MGLTSPWCNLEVECKMHMLLFAITWIILVHEIYSAQTSLITLHLLETEFDSNASAPSTVNNQWPSLPLSVAGSASENALTGGWYTGIWYKGVVGKVRVHSTASDFIQAECCPRQPEICDMKAIFVRNKETGFIARSRWSPVMRSTWRITTNLSTYWLWH